MRQGEKGILWGVLAVVAIVIIVLVANGSQKGSIATNYKSSSEMIDGSNTNDISTDFTNASTNLDVLVEFDSVGKSLDEVSTASIATTFK